MTQSELEQVVRDLSRDFRLTAEQRYTVSAFARGLMSLSDAEVAARAHAEASHATSPTLGAAMNMAGLAIREGRKLSSMSGEERKSYAAANLTKVGASLEDSGSTFLDADEPGE